MKRFAALFAVIAILAAPAAASPRSHVTIAQGTPPGSFELVGHNSLDMRGMNAAPAVYGDYAYIGSRTDGLHPNSGVYIVNIKDPSNPTTVGQIGTPNEDNVGETSRELRIWPQQHLLIVENLGSNCSPEIHECSPTSATVADNFRFYDIAGKNAADPKLVSEYKPTNDPHEFYLWVDPHNSKRALMFISTPGGADQLLITDISQARQGKFTELGKWRTIIPDPATDNRLHSISISPDGKTGYVSYLGGGFFMVDTSDFALGKPKPEVRLITPILNRAHWGDPGTHSAIPIPQSHYVLTTDEVYGRAIAAISSGGGCPWGWMRTIDVKDPTHPKVVAEYKLPQNDPAYCSDNTQNTPDRDYLSSWSSHNPTALPNLAFITWHSGGLQAVDLSDPTHPAQAAVFTPTPEPVVVTEDPALSEGHDKVVMWSYPIIQNGLIYVVDVRNGLYILRYKGPSDSEVSSTHFLEGNSNLGDAVRYFKP
ncbi:MAG: hypothetical protein QOF16_299 [Actinomycetota bacterium]|nr:hypothetical protein [Actinomycetota bacterium]MEA2486645.1 hypothetical protein [Actinomycetota bacterium]